MKFLVVFAALVAVAVGVPSSWTLNELYEAMEDPQLHPAMFSYIKAAFNEMKIAQSQGHPMDYIMVDLPYVERFTKEELAQAILDPNTEPAFLPLLEDAYEDLVQAFFAGIDKKYIDVVFPPGMLTPAPEVISVPEEIVTPVEIPVSAAPLVQIIVNVAKQNQIDSGVVPVEVEHSPIIADHDFPSWHLEEDARN